MIWIIIIATIYVVGIVIFTIIIEPTKTVGLGIKPYLMVILWPVAVIGFIAIFIYEEVTGKRAF